MSKPTVFVPTTRESRKDTAILLVGTAREFGISQHAILSRQGGYLITQELADVIERETESTTKTSGNRAAKNNTTKE